MKKSIFERYAAKLRSRRILTSMELRQLDLFWDAPDKGGFNYDYKLGKVVYELQEKKNESKT